MNSSQPSKENRTLAITSSPFKSKLKNKLKTNNNFYSITTNSNSFRDKSKLENTNTNINYRKTISYLNTPSIIDVDLVKQLKLSDKRILKFDKNYLVNLIKMRIKKDKLPSIMALKTFSPKSDFHYRAFSIDLSKIKLNGRYDFHKTLNFSPKNKDKEKINELYRKVYENNSNNLKSVYVNQFINSNKKIKFEKKEETISVNIKPKILNSINQNFENSQRRFMKYHGFNKRRKFNYKLNFYDIKKDKYPNVDNIQIWQLFLKKKLKILNKDVTKVKDECDIAKDNLLSVYDSFNIQAQKNIEETYSNDNFEL